VWEVRCNLAPRASAAEGATQLVIFRVTGTVKAMEIICDTFPFSCGTYSLKTFNKSRDLIGSAGLERIRAIAAQVWVKVWGSYSKTFPDVPDFAQVTVSENARGST